MKKALLVGINYNNQLKGCINDIMAVKDMLHGRYNWNDFNILTDDTANIPTAANIVKGFDWLVKDVVAGDVIMFYYSGHGAQIPDRNMDEPDWLDEAVVSSDGYAILDDLIFSSLVGKVPKGVTCYLFFDCCHSGSMADLTYNWKCFTQCTQPGPKTYNPSQWITNYSYWQESRKKAEGDIYMLSACYDNQLATETSDNVVQGAFTRCFLDALALNKYKATNRLILRDVTCLLTWKKYTQKPVFACTKQNGLDVNLFM